MDAVFGGEHGVGLAVGGATVGQRATSLEDIVEQLCAEGDANRLWAASELVDVMCEHALAVKIKRAIIKGMEEVGA